MRAVVGMACDDPDPERAQELSARLAERISALQVSPMKARVAITEEISAKNQEYMVKIDKVYSASGKNVEPAFKIMAQYAEAHAALVRLAEPLMDGVSIPIPGLPFADMVRVSMYKMQLERTAALDPLHGKAENADSKIVGAMFDLSEEQQQIVRKNLALPKITSFINKCIEERNYDAGARQAYEKQLAVYGVLPESPGWKATTVDFYYQAVLAVSRNRAVPTIGDCDDLTALKNFLGTADDAAERVNVELFGKYCLLGACRVLLIAPLASAEVLM